METEAIRFDLVESAKEAAEILTPAEFELLLELLANHFSDCKNNAEQIKSKFRQV